MPVKDDFEHVKMQVNEDRPERRVVGVVMDQSETCQHAGVLVLDDDTRVNIEDAIALIDAGGVFTMIPPEGAPARPAYEATGLPLLLQTKTCERCDKVVVFA
jgi:hypothetical protein